MITVGKKVQYTNSYLFYQQLDTSYFRKVGIVKEIQELPLSKREIFTILWNDNTVTKNIDGQIQLLPTSRM